MDCIEWHLGQRKVKFSFRLLSRMIIILHRHQFAFLQSQFLPFYFKPSTSTSSVTASSVFCCKMISMWYTYCACAGCPMRSVLHSLLSFPSTADCSLAILSSSRRRQTSGYHYRTIWPLTLRRSCSRSCFSSVVQCPCCTLGYTFHTIW